MHFIMEEALLKRGQYDLIYVECVLSQKKDNAFRDRQTGETDNYFKTNCNKITSLRLFHKFDFNYKVCYYILSHINHSILMVINLMAITCSKFLSQLLVSSFQLLLPVVVSCIVWMFVVRLWFSFWGQWQNCRLIWTFSCGVLLYYCTCANHTPFQIVQWQVGLRKRSVFLESDESGV